MTIEQAIKHCHEKAEELKKQGSICCDSLEDTIRAEKCLECANEHLQLAEWLEELVELRKDAEADENLAKAGIRLVWQNQGKWLPQTAYDGFTYWRCDNCGVDVDETTDYYPHCGAKMGKENDNG